MPCSQNKKIMFQSITKIHKILASIWAVIFILSSILIISGFFLEFIGIKQTMAFYWFGFIGAGASWLPTIIHILAYKMAVKKINSSIYLSRFLGILYLIFFPVGTLLGLIILFKSKNIK